MNLQRLRPLAFALLCGGAVVLVVLAASLSLPRAIALDDPRALTWCLRLGARPGGPDRYGWTPLHLAAYHDSPQALRLLLARGAYPAVGDAFGWMPLHLACIYGSPEVVTLLLAAGSPLTAADSVGRQPLQMAAARGDSEVVKLLLAAGASATATDHHGWGPLAVAVSGRHRPVVRQLLTAGAKTGASDSLLGATALHLAAFGGDREMVEMLLQAGADPDRADHRGRSALYWAGHWVPDEIPSILHQQSFITTPRYGLPAAALNPPAEGTLAMLRLLLEKGARAQVRDHQGRTPLHEAAAHDDLLAARLLLVAGADPATRDELGFTAYDVARRQPGNTVTSLLAPPRW